MLSISLPKKPKVIEQDKNAHRASIEIRELYPGYGPTIGNALRRALYSSLPGAAITSVKILGVPHEFSTIEGVLEDVLEISLNVKQIRLNLHGDEPQTLVLKAKGKKEITAKDIEVPSQVEILNKNAHILTLTSPKSSIEMEFRVEQGLGYVQVDQDEKDKKEIGVIRLDAVFSPVKKVNFEVENMRVGDKTDYNRLVLDITTDGTVSAEDAFVQATKVMLEHFNLLMSLGGEKVAKSVVKKKTPAKKSKLKTKKKPAKK
ncbi:MAG: DNA-directed RNA polymerase subunit alpha [Candidatus Spechtbacteria bacterium RIFCSPLOWO2_01_FULL_43_12]|uniref:DNA-directed RNA polymerase subunit alpha n=1 Tax=Candidatus Spechtbacteria bacterium RIFCSPLOWO2_01_FULL_43_12 TaxID=1802162 RepID=A0A1G2HEF8_9BACT|nr:MAG: DNA-directed RNA polymerase subunit alpha [Candidatus Spechtbacteria bacterium RIFCSPLOWO2_01_FULL_43_12]